MITYKIKTYICTYMTTYVFQFLSTYNRRATPSGQHTPNPTRYSQVLPQVLPTRYSLVLPSPPEQVLIFLPPPSPQIFLLQLAAHNWKTSEVLNPRKPVSEDRLAWSANRSSVWRKLWILLGHPKCWILLARLSVGPSLASPRGPKCWIQKAPPSLASPIVVDQSFC